LERLTRLNKIDKALFNEWLEHPVTENLLEVLSREIEFVQRRLGEGSALRDDPLQTAVVYREGMGRQGGLAYVLQVEYEDLTENE